MVELYRTPSSVFAPIIINVSQYDFNHNMPNELSFRIKDESGYYKSFHLGSVWLIAARPDGVVYEIKGSIKSWSANDDTCVDFKMMKGMTDVAGDVICEVVHTNRNLENNNAGSYQEATANFILRVEPSPKEIYGSANTVIDESGGGTEPYEPDEPADEPQYRLVVTSPPTKTVYDEGDALDLTGTVITLEKYTDKQGVLEQTNVTSACTFSPANGAALKTTDTTVTVTYYR